MSLISKDKGNSFEVAVGHLLAELKRAAPNRVDVTSQEELHLRDGRTKKIDFGLTYRMLSSRHMVAIECQDRDSWSSEIVDKILSLRAHTERNRFWFVYRDDMFLTAQAKTLLDNHGVMHFSLNELRIHINLVLNDLLAADEWERKRYRKPPNSSSPPPDPAML